jgi:hypothetical protein
MKLVLKGKPLRQGMLMADFMLSARDDNFDCQRSSLS